MTMHIGPTVQEVVCSISTVSFCLLLSPYPLCVKPPGDDLYKCRTLHERDVVSHCLYLVSNRACPKSPETAINTG